MRGITSIEYNHLNLPYRIAFNTGHTLEWIYSATGEQFRKVYKQGSTTLLTQDYSGEFEYRNGLPEAVYHAEGRVKGDERALQYEYTLRDHLGNGRVYLADLNNDGIGTPSDILQDEHYYPFGLRIDDPRQVTGNPENRYLYNGKELSEESDLYWYAYGYRNYDPALGRFVSIDPRADNYYDWSSYNYVLGNPIRNTDPQGDTVRIEGEDKYFDWTPGVNYSEEGNPDYDPFIAQTVTALNHLVENEIGGLKFPNDDNENIEGNVITDFVGEGRYSTTLVQISETTEGTISYADPEYNESLRQILFNPSQGIEFEDNGDQKAGSISPSVALAHEFGHVWFWETAPKKYAKMYGFNDPKFNNIMTEELVLKYVERPAAKKLSQGIRLFYSPANTFQAKNVKSNKKKK